MVVVGLVVVMYLCNSSLVSALAFRSPQYLALKEVYLATNGDQWTNNAHWLEGEPCDPQGGNPNATYQSGWHGITCYNSGMVQSMYDVDLTHRLVGCLDRDG
jgi:hypothetical protein